LKQSLTVLFSGLCLMFLSCFGGDKEDEFSEITTYATQNGIKVKDTLGIFVHIDEVGTGAKPNANNTVILYYKGYYLDDVIFDKTKDSIPLSLKLSSAIPGLQSGIRLFAKDGKGTIIIPSAKAYGDNPPFGVRKNAILVYDINIVEIN